MPVKKLNIKWGKEQFKDVEVNLEDPPIVFKAQLFALSGVQPERQKIMIKGQTIGDVDWSNVTASLKDGVTLMMMGSVDKLLAAPVKETKFMEDLTEEQLAIALDLPVGLKNLGNTCYLNAVVQCLKGIPELCASLSKFKNSAGDMTGSLTLALRDTYDFMEKYKQSEYPPLLLVQLTRTVFPQFSTMGEHGEPQQQDANEFLTEFLRVLQQKLPPVQPTTVGSQLNPIYSSFIDQYFSGTFVCEMKCDEALDEPFTPQNEQFLQLSCFISQEVKYLQTGLKLRLEEKITKLSASLGRDAVYTKTSRVCRLPSYLNVNLVRFFYKEKEKVSAKVLKDVKFPVTLDVYDLCNKELQAKLEPMREAFRVQDEEESKVRKAKKVAENDAVKAVVSATAETTATTSYAPFSFEDDLGSSNSGYYDLIGVLTHKGRSSNSGHYVGWSKNAKTNQWYMFDDDVVTKMTEEDILKLSGGGDWHTAYCLFYGPRRLESKYLGRSLSDDKPKVSDAQTAESKP
jgi:ubiquitin carboxyl-terminal hydrolase 14